MNDMKKFFSSDLAGKLGALLLIVVIAFIFKNMINMLLLTFVLSFFLYTIQNYIFIKLRKLIHIERNFIVAFIYVIIIVLIVLVCIRYIPVVINQISYIAYQVGNFNINNYRGIIDDRVINIIEDINIAQYVKSASDTIVETLTNIGRWSLELFLAFILSFFFIIEKDEIVRFGARLEDSKLAGQYKFIRYYGRSFLDSFAKVMEAQILIATVNSLLSVIFLKIMDFPQVIGLGVMIFVLGLIPVAGVGVSLIPLSIIAFKIGGVMKVIYIWIMIFVIHSLEAYVLNPKIMSINTKLPVFFTFLILLGAEHIMGIWGLLFGIPLFMFILEILDIKER